jgi:dolichol-phosphate mannosyltransferase
MLLTDNLREMERTREAYWRKYPQTSPTRLRWRALTVRHCFHVLPGESILELGAGTGLWTAHLTRVLRGENPITAVVFNRDFMGVAVRRRLRNVKFVNVSDLAVDLISERFDYIVGSAILCHSLYAQNLRALFCLLKPGGQLLFFEANHWNPQVFLKDNLRWLGKLAGHASCQRGMRRYELMQAASRQGFTHIEVVPYDILHPLTPKRLVPAIQSLAVVLEHAPLIREACGTLYIWLKKPGGEQIRRSAVELADRPQLFGTVSVVIPCHNEEMNVEPLIAELLRRYGGYICEIIVVNDNSTDRTAEVTQRLARTESRIKLINRTPPAGVGRALRDGYAAATGQYILTMDSDFAPITPELRDLFDVVAAGRDGAIGSRFSHDSVLINYPFVKIICNRAFHLLANLVLRRTFRDISNNLKLYRAEILKDLAIEQSGFAANVETGLKPLLEDYDIEEVPISWINRTPDMGDSSFRILRVAPGYTSALLRLVASSRWRPREARRR